MLVKDHSQVGDELKAGGIAAEDSPPTQLDQKHKDLVDKLSSCKAPRSIANTSTRWRRAPGGPGKVRARAEAKVPALGAAAGEHSAGEQRAGEPTAGAGARDHDIATTNRLRKIRTLEMRPAAETMAQLTVGGPTVQMHLDRAREL